MAVLETLMREVRDKLDRMSGDHELRIRNLENTVTGMKVRVGLISTGTGGVAGTVGALITYFSSR